MSVYQKVIWSEGMFLRPQHFQQQDRYVEHLIQNRFMVHGPFDWGFYRLAIDTGLLKTGKFALTACSGVFPDGTPFNLPDDDDLPFPIDISQDLHDEIIYLALPLRQVETPETENGDGANGFARFRIHERNIQDYTSADAKAIVQTGKLRTRLMRQSQELSGYSCLGVARVTEVRADKCIIVDDHFIPPSINCHDNPELCGFLRELHGLLNTRSEAIAGRVAAAGQGGVAEVADFLLLQLVNRYLPLYEHLSTLTGLHPEEMYRYCIQLTGELATFLRQEKRPMKHAPYNHEDLQSTFLPLMEAARRLFTRDLDQRAVSIPLKGPKYGTYAAKRPDLNLMEKASFILAASAEVPTETLRREFPQQTIIAPVEEIRQYINSLTPGIAIHALPVAPRQLPFHSGYIYFELDKHSAIWKKMASSGGIVIHMGTRFPGLKLELWAIKEGS